MECCAHSLSPVEPRAKRSDCADAARFSPAYLPGLGGIIPNEEQRMLILRKDLLAQPL